MLWFFLRIVYRTQMNTITEQYLKEQVKLHENPVYGVASVGFASRVAHLINHLSPKTLTDYGAGKKYLKKALDHLGVTNYRYQPFDPAFPIYGEALEADLVCCIDVLEHVEPPFLDNVLLDLVRVTKMAGFITVHTGPAQKHLSDGRNAHLIQKPLSWWLPKLKQFFEVGVIERHEGTGEGFSLVIGRKNFFYITDKF